MTPVLDSTCDTQVKLELLLKRILIHDLMISVCIVLSMHQLMSSPILQLCCSVEILNTSVARMLVDVKQLVISKHDVVVLQ